MINNDKGHVEELPLCDVLWHTIRSTAISHAPKAIVKNQIARANLEFNSIKMSGGLGGAFMNRWIAIFLIATANCAKVGNSGTLTPDAEVFCSDQWFRFVEEKVPTGDGQGHGPDIGSDEWMSAIEFKLGIRGKSDIPNKNSDVWCRHIDQIVRANLSSSDINKGASRATMGPGPSYACSKVKAGSIETTICQDMELSELDRKLSDVYGAAYKKAANEHPTLLTAEQRGWIKGRNECWKSNDKRGCVRNEYQLRIAELQARYRLIPGNGPIRFMCEENSANEVVAPSFKLILRQ
ncbi:MAG: lysozyme inhibitor LprI family protein [Desulforhopalus sp.]